MPNTTMPNTTMPNTTMPNTTMPNTTMSATTFLADLPLAGDLVAVDFAGWSPELRAEFDTHSHDGEVGSRLLSQTPRARVWEIRLTPGERWHAHRHVLDYFWTAINAGRSRQHTHDGTVREVSYQAGETRYLNFAKGEYLLHDIENVGDTELIFTTVEHLDSANAPLDLTQETSK